MQKPRYFIFVLLMFSFLVSCNKLDDQETAPQAYELNFSITSGKAPTGLKESPGCLNEGANASYVEITIMAEGAATTEIYRTGVFYIDGQPYTNSIKLSPGNYTIHEFILRNDNQTPGNLADDPVIAAAVHEGAPYANLVSVLLTKDFTISPFRKNLLAIELVCYDEAGFTNFGFQYFQLDQTVIREQHFFGDLCISNITEYYNSPYAAALGGNGNLLLDLPAIYQIEVIRNGVTVLTQNNNSATGVSAPMTVRYADRTGVVDQFEFRLSVMLPGVSGFSYEYMHSLTFADDQQIAAGTDGVVDFVLGNCQSDADLVIPFAGGSNAPPSASAVVQTGNPMAGMVLLGDYQYADPENDPEGTSVYQWYRADDASGLNEVPVAGATGMTYTIQSADIDKYLRFSVIPVASAGNIQGSMVKASVFAGPVTPPAFICGSALTVNHVAGNVSPVTKTVVYNTTGNIPGEPGKCWITSNLGASGTASARNDATEASAGWYWQFNTLQGYKHSGSARTPQSAWNNTLNENSDWTEGNDPCADLLGSGWRIPTTTEWENVDAAGSWNRYHDTYNSALKIHAAGHLKNWNGTLTSRGSEGFYWSSSQSGNSRARSLYLDNSGAYINQYGDKASAASIRCLKDN